MHSSESLNVRGQMRRQLARQQQQQRQQEQQQAGHHPPADRELPAKQNQTHHNPVAETMQRGAFPSDQ